MGKIYVFVNGESKFGLHMIAVAEDGEALTGHLSSHIGWGRHDMGLDGSDWKHDKYAAKYPDGFELEFVENPDTHEALSRLIEKANAEAAEAEPESVSEGEK